MTRLNIDLMMDFDRPNKNKRIYNRENYIDSIENYIKINGSVPVCFRSFTDSNIDRLVVNPEEIIGFADMFDFGKMITSVDIIEDRLDVIVRLKKMDKQFGLRPCVLGELKETPEGNYLVHIEKLICFELGLTYE